MHLRAATSADIETALALVESGFRGESSQQGWTHEAHLLGGQRTDAEAIAEIVGDPDQTLLLAHDDAGALVGCVVIADKGMRDGERIAYLGMLTVSPLLQNAGLGRRLLAASEAHAKSFDAAIMEMTVIKQRQELIDWYLRRGYALTGREEPFPLDDPRFGLPKTRELVFVVLAKPLRT